MTMNTSEIISNNMKLFDLFIEEEMVKVKFDDLSPEEQNAHSKSVSDVILQHVLHTPLDVFCLPVDKFERDRIAEEIIEKYLAAQSIAPPRRTRAKNPLRHRADGTYNSHCLDPDYSHNYYAANLQGVTVKCPCCESEILKTNLAKHKKSLKCRHVAMCQAHNAKP